MKKRVITSLILTAALAFGALTGCGSKADSQSSETAATGEETQAEAETDSASDSDKTITVGATPVPHAEILDNIVKEVLAKDGWTLETVVFQDYVLPNTSLESGDIDANYFQTLGYLDQQNKDAGLHLTAVAGIHIEPMGVYSKKVKNLKDLKDGATVSIPNDPTNGGRALALLAKAGLITLKDGVGVTATVQDVTGNPKNIKFQELEPAQVPRTLDDVDAAVINSNFAMQVQLNPVKDNIFIEDSTSPYVNIVAVRTGDENRPEIQALMKALKSEKVKKFINEKYNGAVVPAF